VSAGDLIGRTVDGWRIESLLGQGGMGAVFRAENKALSRAGALKVLLGGKGGGKAAARLKREVELLARLSHPGIVHVLGAGSLGNGFPYYVMELVPGRSLDAIVEEEAPLAPRRAATLVAKIARALGHAHDQGIAHRDVKPTNVVVRPDDTPVVLDFGLAKAILEDEAERLSVTGQLLGTFAYMSPEHAAGGSSAAIGPPSDVFALGVVLYELLTKERPFDADNFLAAVVKIQSETPASPHSIVAGIPAPLEAICAKALAKAPRDRYPDGTELALDLERFLEGSRVHARGSSLIGQVSTVLRHRALVGAALAGALIVGGAVLGVIVASSHLEGQDGSSAGLRSRAQVLRMRAHELRASMRLEEHLADQAAAKTREGLRDAADAAAAMGPRAASASRADLDGAVAEARVALAALAIRRGDVDRAEAELEAASHAPAGDAPSRALAAARGLVLDARGRFREALPLLEKASGAPAGERQELDELFPPPHLDEALTRALVAAGRAGEAVAALDRVLARPGVDPRSAETARTRLARARARLAAHEETAALAEYEAARALLLTYDPLAAKDAAFAHAYSVRGKERQTAGDARGAASDYRAGAELDPAAFDREIAKAAAGLLERAGLDALAGMLNAMVATERPTGERMRDAHALLDLALALDPARPVAPAEYVDIEKAMCKSSEKLIASIRFVVASRFRRRGVPFDPSDDLHLYARGEGDFGDAERVLRLELSRAAPGGKTDGTKVAAAYRRFSHVVRDAMPEVAYEAEEEFRGACPKERFFEWEIARGLTLRSLGKIEEAQKLLDDAVRATGALGAPDRADALFWRGTFECAAGRHANAIRDLGATIDLQTGSNIPFTNGWPFLSLALSLRATGKNAEAFAALQKAQEIGGIDDMLGARLRADLRRDLGE
jgi:tetratricopeptide (TPR) repeat protein